MSHGVPVQCRAGPLVLAAALVVASVGAARAESGGVPWADWELGVSASTGFSFLQGDYGERDLDESLAVPLGVAVDWGPLSLGVTLPIERATVDASVRCVGPRGRSLPGPCALYPILDANFDVVTFVDPEERSWGPGDLSLDLSATWMPGTEGWVPALTPFAGLRLPTGDVDDALGTGSVDATLGLDASWLVWGGVLPFVSGGYTFVHDREDLGLRSYAFASAGVAWAPVPWGGVSLAYDWRDASAEGEGDGHELAPAIWLRLGEHLTLEPYGVIGLSRSAPDFGIGARVRVSR